MKAKTKKFEIEIEDENLIKYRNFLSKELSLERVLERILNEILTFMNIPLVSVKEIKPQEPTMWQIRDIDSGEILYDDIPLEKALEIGERFDKNKVIYVPKPKGNWVL